MKHIQPEPYRAVLNRINKRDDKCASPDVPPSDVPLPEEESSSDADFYKRLEEFRRSNETSDTKALR
jgi:hypothetical protein